MLGTKERYSVVALVCIACRQDGKPVPLTEIASSQCISIGYLEQLFRVLRDQRIVRSVRGYGGGYLLARNPANISLLDVVTAFQEKGAAELMPASLGDSREWSAETYHLAQTTKRFLLVLKSTTLQQLVESSHAFRSDASALA